MRTPSLLASVVIAFATHAWQPEPAVGVTALNGRLLGPVRVISQALLTEQIRRSPVFGGHWGTLDGHLAASRRVLKHELDRFVRRHWVSHVGQDFHQVFGEPFFPPVSVSTAAKTEELADALIIDRDQRILMVIETNDRNLVGGLQR